MPDRNGRVEARKIWEFMNVPETLEEWLPRRADWPASDQIEQGGLVHISDPLCQCVRDYCAPWPANDKFSVG